LQEQIEAYNEELEDADNNYDKLMDMFADTQRNVDRMRMDLNVGAQLIEKLQEEKLHLLEELEKASREQAANARNEDYLSQIREL
jgi:hypothetical protein